jgi:RHS repeat-associated protein
LGSTGSGLTDYGYTGEMQSQGLLDLRARWYNPTQGRFLSRDIWQGDLYKPISYNAWLYGYSNPIIYIDPTGHTIEPPYCPYGCLIWDYSNVGGSGFGGRLTRAVISTGTELIDFLLTNGATQTNPKACTWNLAGAEDRFVSGTIPPTLLGVIGGRQLPLPGFEQYLDDTTRQIHHIITNCSFAKVGE